MGTQKSNELGITWGVSKAPAVTLSNAVKYSNGTIVDFTKRATLYAVYTPGASGRELKFKIQFNPMRQNKLSDVETITNDEYWSTLGEYERNVTILTPLESEYQSAESTGTSPMSIVPIPLPQIDAAQIRIGAWETDGDNTGGVEFILIENTIN